MPGAKVGVANGHLAAWWISMLPLPTTGQVFERASLLPGQSAERSAAEVEGEIRLSYHTQKE